MLLLVHRVVVLVVLFALAGCASMMGEVEERTTHGPKAEQIWMAQVMERTGRVPTFEESNAWRDQSDRRISRFLVEHPEVANSFEVQGFRFDKQVAVGMTKEQVTILLGPPEATVTDVKELEKLARKYWPSMKDRVSEAWLYTLGWRVFMHEDKVVDLVQFLSPKSPF
jgi:hypothetical protein